MASEASFASSSDFTIPASLESNTNGIFYGPERATTVAQHTELVFDDIDDERPPWEDGRDGRHEGIAVAGKYARRSPREMLSDARCPEDDRRRNWSLCRLMASKLKSEELLLRRTEPGELYTLRPSPRSSVPLQWAHVSPRTIPDSTADMPCTNILDILRRLNILMRTEPEAVDRYGYLERVVAVSCDFGEVYARMRPWWDVMREPHESHIYGFDASRSTNDDSRRLTDSRIGDLHVGKPNLPPRRVWDLYSNRVVPFSVLRRDASSGTLNVPYPWTVSHSWVADDDRVDVWTNINGRRWPVPIPRATTLEHVRVELLNMGAEYAWLDVLCLRLKEWEVDVPTIGHIYREEDGPTR